MMRLRQVEIVLLLMASSFLLAALGSIVALGSITGIKGDPPKNYQFLVRSVNAHCDSHCQCSETANTANTA